MNTKQKMNYVFKTNKENILEVFIHMYILIEKK